MILGWPVDGGLEGRIVGMNDAKRRRAAMKAAEAADVQGLVVTPPADVRYLTGFTGSNGALALAGGKAVLFTDGRYKAQARAEAAGVRVVIAAKPAVAAACEWMGSAGVGRCGFDAAHTTVAELELMRRAVRGAKARRVMFVPVGPLVARMREVKDAGE